MVHLPYGSKVRYLTSLALVILCFLCGGARAGSLNVVAFGDSLTAGLGLAAHQAFPAKLETALKARGLDITIVNAGVSGDTAAGGLARLDWSVPEGIDAVLLELGANDALRGLDPAQTRAALDEIVTRLKARNIPVMLFGMRAPPNLGPDYLASFNAIYPDLAAKHGIALYPFFLEGVAAEAALNQPDGMHPNAAGVERIVELIAPAVETFLRQVTPRK